MDTINVVKMFNEDGLGLKEIAEKVNISKSTIQRNLIKAGYQYNRKANKYEINISDETINNGNNVETKDVNTDTNVTNGTTNIETNVSRETIDIVNRTYGIPSDIDRALKIKCAIEGTKVVDIVREALKNAVDPKYFDYK